MFPSRGHNDNLSQLIIMLVLIDFWHNFPKQCELRKLDTSELFNKFY